MNDYARCKKIVGMCPITATPGGVYAEFGEIYIPNYIVLGFNCDNYRGVDFCDFKRLSEKTDTPEDMKYIIKEYKEHAVFLLSGYHTLVDNNCLVEGDRRPYILFPGKRLRVTHEAIVKMCHLINKNTVVVIVDGKGIMINFLKRRKKYWKEYYWHIPEKDYEGEITDTIWDACIDLELTKRPLVITGNQCIGSSLTLMDDREGKIGTFTSTVFARGVISMKTKKDGEIYGQERAYQLDGRNAGRRLNEEKIPTYCDKIFENAVKTQERMTENQLNYQERIMTEEEYNAPEVKGVMMKKIDNYHLMRYIIGEEKSVTNEDGWKRYKNDEIANFYDNEDKEEAIKEAMRDLREYANANAINETGSHKIVMKEKCSTDDRFYRAHMGKVLPEISSIDEVYRYCVGYNKRRKGRGDFYCCYRNKNDPNTLELWFIH